MVKPKKEAEQSQIIPETIGTLLRLLLIFVIAVGILLLIRYTVF